MSTVLQVSGTGPLSKQHWFVWQQKFLFTLLPDSGIQVYDVVTHALLVPLISIEKAVCLVGCEEKNMLFVGSSDGKIYQINLPNLQVSLGKEFKMAEGRRLESFCFIASKGAFIALIYDARSEMSHVLGSNNKSMLQAKGKSILSYNDSGVVLLASNHPQKGSKVQKWDIINDAKAQKITTFSHDSYNSAS